MNIDKEIFEALNLDSFTDRPLEDDEVVLVFMGTLRKAWKARAALDEQKARPSDEEILAMIKGNNHPYTSEQFIAFARALLSKYAAPAPKGEPSDDQLVALALEMVPDATEEQIRLYGHLWVRLCRMALARFSYAAPVNEQAAKDAERYRYARNNIKEDYMLSGSLWLSDQGGISWDKTIDAAIQQSKGES